MNDNSSWIDSWTLAPSTGILTWIIIAIAFILIIGALVAVVIYFTNKKGKRIKKRLNE